MSETNHVRGNRPYINPAFWNPNDSPKVDSSKTFLIDALQIVGKSMHSEDWSGGEIQVSYWQTQPSPQKAELEIWDDDRKAFERLTEAAEWLAQRCRDGEVHAFTRSRRGCEAPCPMPPEEWMGEPTLSKYFSEGGYERWFSYNPPNHQRVFIFIDRATLAATVESHLIVKRGQFQLPAEAYGVHLSSYLKLALATVIALDLRPANQPKKQTVVDKIKELAEAHGLADEKFLSPSAIKYLAQFVREPSSTLGRATKTNGSDP